MVSIFRQIYSCAFSRDTCLELEHFNSEGSGWVEDKTIHAPIRQFTPKPETSGQIEH